MKKISPKILLAKQTNPCLPDEAANQHPLRQAIHQVLRETTHARIMPLVALSLAGLAGPALAQQARVDLADLDGSSGFVLNGKTRDDDSGFSVSSVGDINGDGFDDVVIGSRIDETYVVFGGSRVGSSGIVELSALNGSNGFVLNGVGAGEFEEVLSNNTGNQVSAAGDVNGDGIDDLLIGASGGLGSSGVSSTIGVNGASYVVFGASGLGASGTVELTALNGDNGFVLNGIAGGGASSYSVSAVGDINGDGNDDLLIGARDANPNGNKSGASYAVFGASEVGSSGMVELSALDGSNGFVLNGVTEDDRSGGSVSAAGDVNNDGIDDLLIGAIGADPNGDQSGASYVVFGTNGVGSSGTLELSTLDGSNGFVLNGEAERTASGASVSAAGDINNDGIDDLLIGVFSRGNNGDLPIGATGYVVFGANGVGNSGTLELSTLDGSNGFVLDDDAHAGYSVSAAGDVNGDGVDDLLIGVPYSFCINDEDDAECFSLGASYVVFGASGVGASGAVELSMLDGSDGFLLKGVLEGDDSGSAVSAAGDVNGDGIDDLLIGAPGAPRRLGLGASYIVFGQSFDNPVPELTILDVPVSASRDDAEESVSTGNVKPGSSDLEFGDQGGKNQLVGMRFNSLNIPPGATITNASIQFQVDETHSGAATLMIEGQATDNVPIFAKANDNISSRERTNAVVDWTPAPWTTVGETGSDQKTSDISSIIQEIVDRQGWSSGNSLAIIITGTGRRTAESFDGDVAGAPVLHVEYQ